jgi:hypothetical protein
MSSLGTSKGILEIAKFGVYVTVPIVLMYVYASNTDNTLHKFIGKVLTSLSRFLFSFLFIYFIRGFNFMVLLFNLWLQNFGLCY